MVNVIASKPDHFFFRASLYQNAVSPYAQKQQVPPINPRGYDRVL